MCVFHMSAVDVDQVEAAACTQAWSIGKRVPAPSRVLDTPAAHSSFVHGSVRAGSVETRSDMAVQSAPRRAQLNQKKGGVPRKGGLERTRQSVLQEGPAVALAS